MRTTIENTGANNTIEELMAVMPKEIRGYGVRIDYIWERSGNTFTNSEVATKIRFEVGYTKSENPAAELLAEMLDEEFVHRTDEWHGAWGYNAEEWEDKKEFLIAQAEAGSIDTWVPIAKLIKERYGWVAPDTRGLLDMDPQDITLTLEGLVIEYLMSAEELQELHTKYADAQKWLPTSKRSGVQYYKPGPYAPEVYVTDGEAGKWLASQNTDIVK